MSHGLKIAQTSSHPKILVHPFLDRIIQPTKSTSQCKYLHKTKIALN